MAVIVAVTALVVAEAIDVAVEVATAVVAIAVIASMDDSKDWGDERVRSVADNNCTENYEQTYLIVEQ